MLFPTTLVGSYPQPEWLIDREKLSKQYPPRVRVQEEIRDLFAAGADVVQVDEPWMQARPEKAIARHG